MSAGRGRTITNDVSLGLCLGLLALALSACTNNLLAGAGLSSSSNSSLNGTKQIFQITTVIQDQNNPSGAIDVIGDGTSAMGTYCYASGGDQNAGVDGVGTTSSSSTTSSGQTGTSDCGCTYTWTDPETQEQGSVNVNTSYHESNMIECPYSMEIFPSDVTQISVSVYLIAEDISPATGSQLLSLGNGSGSGVSLTSTLNYTPVTRWQCRDALSLPYLNGLDGGSLGQGNEIYDPILSENTELTYPLDYYTTNLGGTLAYYVQSSTPSTIEDVPNCTGSTVTSDPNNNYTLYSEEPDINGSYMIYPSANGDFDRSTFYLSKTQVGVFTIPLNAYIAPNMISASSNIGGPLGYGAAPVVTGTNEESCPSVSIPSGYHWVKVWLFRMALTNRTYPVSPEMTQVAGVACNPGDFSGTATKAFADCGSFNTSNITSGELADRILAEAGLPSTPDPLCVDMNLPGSGGSGQPSGAGATYDSGGSNYAAYTSFGLGTDIWVPYTTAPITSANATDPLDLFGHKYGATTQYIPKDETLTSQAIDSTQRYDFVYVVSPPTIMAYNMENNPTSTELAYFPMRFQTSADCSSANPNNCSFTNVLSKYQIMQYDVSSSEGAPGTVIYPMCALQPN